MAVTPTVTRISPRNITNAQSVEELNTLYQPLTIDQRVARLYQDFDADSVMLTSAFAATSALLLDVFRRVAPWQTVFFIDTGYHFPETMDYKKQLTELFGLTVQDIKPEHWKHDFTRKDQTWKSDPDLCCSINKVEPLYNLKKDYAVWISGLMSWQTERRASLDIFEQRDGILKFYPLIDVTREEREAYLRFHHLPFHPLLQQGFESIGCAQCTRAGKDRSGRWNNSPKTECGLHL
jgi:phosphoadenosine phosphosulfate reductase